MALIESFVETGDNPLAVVESMALRNDWSFERSVEDEIAIAVAGKLRQLSDLVHLDGRH